MHVLTPEFFHTEKETEDEVENPYRPWKTIAETENIDSNKLPGPNNILQEPGRTCS